MKFVHLRLSPHFLTEDQKKKWVKMAKNLLKNLKEEEATGFEFVMTGDESWFYYHYPQKEIWILNGEDVPNGHKNEPYAKKSMFTIFVNGKGVQIIDLKPIEIKITGDYFLGNILMTIEQSDLMIKSKKWKHRLCLHNDNAPSHCSKIVKNHIENSSIKIWDHPPYSPDLAICDFGLFGTMKNSFTGSDFNNEDELLDSIQEFFASKSEEFYKSLFSEWIRRLHACIQNKGNYFH